MIAAGLIHTLRRFGERKPENRELLEKWLDAAIKEVANNKGNDLVNSSANGVSFSQAATMTNGEWCSVLDRALHMIERGIKTADRAYGQII